MVQHKKTWFQNGSFEKDQTDHEKEAKSDENFYARIQKGCTSRTKDRPKSRYPIHDTATNSDIFPPEIICIILQKTQSHLLKFGKHVTHEAYYHYQPVGTLVKI